MVTIALVFHANPKPRRQRIVYLICAVLIIGAFAMAITALILDVQYIDEAKQCTTEVWLGGSVGVRASLGASSIRQCRAGLWPSTARSWAVFGVGRLRCWSRGACAVLAVEGIVVGRAEPNTEARAMHPLCRRRLMFCASE